VTQQLQKSIDFRRIELNDFHLWTLTMEAWRLKMEPLGVYRPGFADSHNHFHEEQDQDPNKKLDPDPL
jgi:hypothetical protein